VKFASGLAAMGSGLALGREGPTVQMGGGVGAMVADLFRVRSGEGERRALISAGAGAGLAAAFNAPLSGLVFVLEELHGRFTPVMFVAAFIACMTADVVSRLMVGELPVYHLTGMTAPGVASLPLAAALGLLAGVAGVGFNRALLAVVGARDRLKLAPPWVVALVAGALVGVACAVLPELAGPGGRLVQQVISGHVAASLLVTYLVVRFAMTLLSYATGAAGGIFSPLLVLGAVGGAWFGASTVWLLPAAHAVPPQVFCVLGMGALFTATVRAPLTGIVLMIELTGDYGFMLPLLLSCLCAYGVAEALGNAPIYHALRALTPVMPARDAASP
jgi:CIC family chloride channel protein